MSSSRQYMCQICDKSYSTGFNLNKHLKKHDVRVETSPKSGFDATESSISTVDSSSLLSCPTCNKSYSSRSNLKRHCKMYGHGKKTGQNAAPSEISQRPISFPKTCVMCQSKMSKVDILLHYTSEHGIQITSSRHRFDTMDEFFQWKRSTEKNTVSSFVKHRSDRVLNDGSTKRYYSCHRSGLFKSKSKGIRRVKAKGSNKIKGFCPAQILVLQKPEEVIVEFIESHVGHENSVEEKNDDVIVEIPLEDTSSIEHQDGEIIVDLNSLKNSEEQTTILKQICSNYKTYIRTELKKEIVQRVKSLTELIEQTDDSRVLEIINNGIKSIESNVKSADLQNTKDTL